MPHKNASVLRLVSCTLLCLSTVFNPLFAFSAHAADPLPRIVIGEISWAGSSLSTSDEWVELWNLSDQDVSLDGWRLDGMGENGKTIVLPADSTISAHEVFVIANYGSADAKSAGVFPPQVVTTTVSISNSQLMIGLFDDTGSLVDSAGDGGSPPAGASLPQKITMLRKSVDMDGASAEAWVSAEQSLHLKAGVEDLGTPGICDFCAPTSEDTIIPPADTSSTEILPPTEEQTTTSTATDIVNPTETTTSSQSIEDTDITDVSSTALIAPEPDVTSDDTTIGTEALATSTESLTDVTDSSSTSSENTVTQSESSSVATSISTTYSNASTQTASVETPKPNYNLLRLNEIMAYPSSGKEWIEIISLDSNQAINLKSCQIFDSTGRIYTISDLTIDPATSSYAVIELPLSKLNNDGDGVALYSPDGQLLDAMRFGKTTKDRSWIRYPEVTGNWQSTLSPTKGSANLLTQAETSTNTPTLAQDVTNSISTDTASPVTAPAATSVNQTDTTVPDVSSGAATNDDALDAYKTIVWPETAIQPTTAKTSATTKTNTPKSTTKTVKTKTTATKATSATKTTITPIEINDLPSMANNNIRVRLEGVVGSFPGSIANHSFILLSPQGRGLLVKAPVNSSLPQLNTRLVITGTLSTSDKNVVSLKMAATDAITSVGEASSSGITPQIVDLFSPGAEDAWSLVEIVGEVNKVSRQNVYLDVDGIDLTVVIKPDIKYRPQRLLAGDTVKIRGVLDTSKSPLRLLPMHEDDIQIVSHATPAASTIQDKTPVSLPPWMPLGAAGGAIVVTEGARRLNRRRKQKKLEERLAEITDMQTQI